MSIPSLRGPPGAGSTVKPAFFAENSALIVRQSGEVPTFGVCQSHERAAARVAGVRRFRDALALRKSYNSSMTSVVSRNPNIMHGTPCFAGTRVAVRSLFDHLEAGYSIEQFLAEFPTVRRDQVIALLEEMKNDVEQSASAGSR